MIILSSEVSNNLNSPFNRPENNESFANLIFEGKNKGLDLFISHYTNYDGISQTTNCWTHDNKWKKVGNINSSNIWDRAIVEPYLKKHIQGDFVFNHPELNSLLNDKLKISSFLKTLPTTHVNGSIDEIIEIIDKLKNTNYHEDLDNNQLIFKPRFGYESQGIYLINSNVNDDEINKLKQIEGKDYIVQPFLETSYGIPNLNINTRHDLRITGFNGKPIMTFVRAAKKNEFRCGVKYGAEIIPYDIDTLNDIQRKIFIDSDNKFNEYSPRLYSVDIGKGKSDYWIFEFNSIPSIVWEPSEVVKKHFKNFHKTIINNLIKYIN